ncbi:uncharacterized protein FIBRA_04953 [Fibroporia radiculosa]|uniref:Uncharacterized protein n=1 Tax=Fibroporia radiculosa TaxID=599839 RepID=J4IAF9_9APHY|nr:uncharacterized protein FIBRA_04953 [Fibroporia radiculosa]CCM02841.1 predicted protein [Fibroporia radiculosa]
MATSLLQRLRPVRPLRTLHPRPRHNSHSAGPRHVHFYSDLVPGMIPVALLGSAVYLGLRLAQSSMSHEKYLEEALERVTQLEAEVDALRNAQAGRALITSPSSEAKSRWRLW